MSVKTLMIATAALAASTAMTLPSLAAGPDAPGAAGANPPAAAATMPLPATVLFNLLDTNHDGAVDKDEFTTLSNAVFAALDANNDGKLTQEELHGRIGAMLMQRGGQVGPGMMHQGGQRWHGRGGPGMMGRMGFDGFGPHGQQGAGNGPQGGPPDFASLDTNGDGVISQDEFTAQPPVPGPGTVPDPQQ